MLEADHLSPQLSPCYGHQFDQRVAFPDSPWPNLPEYDASMTTEMIEVSPLTPCSYSQTSAGVSTCGEDSQCDMTPEETHSGPKKKKRNRKPLTPTIALRRRVQNRDAQRAYRERKEQKIRELEAQCAAAEQTNEALKRAYANLCDRCMCLSGLQPDWSHLMGVRGHEGCESTDQVATNHNQLRNI
ncbi:hypothetical protein B0T11DRAFT_142243 [Plectosphaerella cucumerina]|uniref:Putative transcription factor kapC n=1 Tax=Plectosphaerella cucumerina TaxID=40658 RepID=A0A8K0T4A7_9PEZI|nr:hypothetical protein B0T11DRAFT_142243 [Plectosphaerella cucumerina]